MTQRVLIVDDHRAVCTALSVLFELNGIETIAAHSPEEALHRVRSEVFGAIIQDMNFSEDATGGEEGIQLFRKLHAVDPDVPIILLTAWTSLETAVKLVKQGAHDYLAKPWDDERLVAKVHHLLELRKQALPAEKLAAGAIGGFICADPKTQRLVATALKVAAADVPILITGPNGAGKEMLAQIIQTHSTRKSKPFLTVNAGALPPDLLEAELFGAEAGAFTGASRRRVGRFEEAHGGTLFLDEIGNLPMAGQIKLLRVLQTGEYARLGSNQTLHADVRIISATNASLPEAIANGKFREDLFFRLNVVELALPPLSERRGDILPIAHHFLESLSQGSRKSLAPEAEAALLEYPWPGNVRELRNRIQRAMLIASKPVLTASDLELESPAQAPSASMDPDSEDRQKVERALFEAGGNVSQAAGLLGISRQALYRRMNKFGLVWEKRPKYPPN